MNTKKDSMVILDLVQGSDKWLKARLDHCTASEAPAMMNDSKFTSRDELLDLKAGWKKNPDSEFKKRLFEDGHRFEAEARPLVEMDIIEDLPPVVGSRVIDDLLLLASFDGLKNNQSIVWEHKGWNEVLAENTRNHLFTPHYYWQLEHQLLVSGADYCLFTVSDGSADKRVTAKYYPVEGRREALIAGWKQFNIDLKKHTLEAKQEYIPANDKSLAVLPVIEYEVNGSLIISNAEVCLARIQDLAHVEMSKILQTDQDFENKRAFNKMVKDNRQMLKDVQTQVTGNFVSYSHFVEILGKMDAVLQKVQSDGERQVNKWSSEQKGNVIKDAEASFKKYIDKQHKRISPVKLSSIESLSYPDFDAAAKNKRTLPSIRSAVKSAAAIVRAEVDAQVERVLANLMVIASSSIDYPELFNDTASLAIKDPEALQAIIKNRITEAKEAAFRRAEKEKTDLAAKERAEEERNRLNAEATIAEDIRIEQQAEEQRMAEEKQRAEALELQQSMAAVEETEDETEDAAETAVTNEEKAELLFPVPVVATRVTGRMLRKSVDTSSHKDPVPESDAVIDYDDPYVRGYIDCLNDYVWTDYNRKKVVGPAHSCFLLEDAISKFWNQYQADKKAVTIN
jgi:predicted phage-related endonuclease